VLVGGLCMYRSQPTVCAMQRGMLLDDVQCESRSGAEVMGVKEMILLGVTVVNESSVR
jgi:hypothetical protein